MWTVLAILNIIRHSNQWNSIPFINPMLWIDWVAIYCFSGFIRPPLSFISAFISAVIGIVIYSISLWLVIGYAFLGYGTLQYEVLDIPSLCNQDVSYQTDPRRPAFLIMHETYFVISTIGFIILLRVLYYRGTVAEEGPMPNYLKVAVIICFVLPATAGTVLAAVMHSHRYLILLHNSCYGSFVSGKSGYLDLYTIPLAVKIGTMMGVNI
jgi:hypothetical protein